MLWKPVCKQFFIHLLKNCFVFTGFDNGTLCIIWQFCCKGSQTRQRSVESERCEQWGCTECSNMEVVLAHFIQQISSCGHMLAHSYNNPDSSTFEWAGKGQIYVHTQLLCISEKFCGNVFSTNKSTNCTILLVNEGYYFCNSFGNACNT